MVISESTTTTVSVTVDRPMNHHGTMTVEVAETNETRHLVEFAPGVRRILSHLPSETTLPVEMRQLPSRGSCWRVVSVGSASTTTSDDVDVPSPSS